MADLLFTDAALRDRYRALMRESAATAHIDEATWVALAADQLDQAGRDAAFDHILSCAECSRLWHGIQEFRRAAITDGLLAPEDPVAAPAYRRYVPIAIAAALILAVGGVVMVRQRNAAPEVVRGSIALAPVEGLMMAYSPEGVPTFVWTPVSTATRYHVEIFTEDGRPAWSRDAQSPTAEWPSDVPRVTGAFRWRVEALNGEAAIARSRLTAVEIPR
jgi:hypothetical protein